MKNLRNGFTLIETLISILIIVTVLTAVSLSASAIKSTARANKVISDMYMWKTAALAWYAEHKDEVKANSSVGDVATKDAEMYYGTESENKLFRDEVAKYLNNAKNISGAGDANVFKMKCDKINRRWFVCYNFPNDPTITRDLRKKLALRAQEAGLLKTRKEKNNTIYDGTQDYLYLLVIDFNIAK